MKRIKNALIYIITALLLVMNISFAPIVKAEGDNPTATTDNAVIAMILAYLAASGMTFNWQSAGQAFSSVGDWFSQYATSIGNTVTLSAIAADAAVVNGGVKIAGKSAQVIQDFQSWLVNTYSLPYTGTTNVIQGSNIYSNSGSVSYYKNGATHVYNIEVKNSVKSLIIFYECTEDGHLAKLFRFVFLSTADGDIYVNNVLQSHNYGTFGGSRVGYYAYADLETSDYIYVPVSNIVYTGGLYIGLADHVLTRDEIYDRVIGLKGSVWDVPSTDTVDANTLALDNSKVWTSDNALLLDMAGAIAKTGENVAALTDTVGVIAGSIANSASLAKTDVTARTVAADYTVPSDQTASSYGVIGLDDVFPFCIPFDVYYIIKALDHAPEAPVIPFVIKADGIVDYRQDLDLSSWNTVAEVFRNCEVIAFIFSLVLVTRRLIRG